MRILVVHNFYRSGVPSGENMVVRMEGALLREHGHDVEEVTRSNDEERDAPLRTRAEAALFMAWNFGSASRVRHAIARFRPDVVHVHNTFPLLSPSVVAAAHRAGVPVICTVHNYRLFCAAAVLVRDRRSCTECIDRRSALPGLVHGCYGDSRLKTLPLAVTIEIHRRLGTWQTNVDRFLAVSDFQREQLAAAGLPAAKISVKPNFVVPPSYVVPWSDREDRAAFVGRLSSEKGGDVLIDAWCAWGGEAPLLEIIGDGSDRRRLEAMATARGGGDRIRFLGQLSSEATRRRIAGARLLVQPAVWPETFGMSVIEAYSAGVPVVASRVGALATLIEEGETGLLAAPGDSESLGSALRAAWMDPIRLGRMGGRARTRYERFYSPPANHEALLRTYTEVLASRPLTSSQHHVRGVI